MLYAETAGEGPDLLLLHGWGLHGGVWEPLMPALTPRFRVTRVDLPGHGYSHGDAMPEALTALTRQVLEVAPPCAVWLGWSFGGLVAMRAAREAGGRVRALVLTNTTPCFVTAPDWSHAMPPAQLEEFAAGLRLDYRGTLLRFLSLQVRGGEAGREALRQLREILFERDDPDPTSLMAALHILRDSDLRTELPRLTLPALVITGGYDRLTPPRAGAALAHALPGGRLQTFERAAHAPFLSQPAEFLAALVAFVDEVTARATREVSA